jgi:TolA-binding protein
VIPTNIKIPALILCLALSFIQAARGQDFVSSYNQAITAVQGQQWDAGLAAVNNVLSKTSDEDGRTQYGPAYGHFYFLRGLLSMGKQDFRAAADAYSACYERFPNDGSENEDGKSRNDFHSLALVQWSNCLVELEQWGEATTRYEEALKNTSGMSRQNKYYLGINLGRCYLKSGQLEKGHDFIVRPLRLAKFSPSIKQRIFTILAQDWSPHVDLEPTQDFVREFGHIVEESEPLKRIEANQLIIYMAQEAIQNGDARRALLWYSLAQDPRAAVDLAQGYIDQAEAKQATLKQNEQKQNQAYIDSIQTKQADYLKQYHSLLNGQGSAYFQLQNFPASLEVFRQLSRDTTEADTNYAVYLHNAALSAAQMSEWDIAIVHSSKFLNTFPSDHLLAEAVRKVMGETYFLEGDYQQAYEFANDIRQGLQSGSAARDVMDFIVGASAFHLGNYSESFEELSNYRSTYPNGQRIEPATYFAAAAAVQLQDWTSGLALMQALISNAPQSELLPNALYLGGLCAYMLDETSAALDMIERIEREFSDLSVLPLALNVKGDVYTTSEDFTNAQALVIFAQAEAAAAEHPDLNEVAAAAISKSLALRVEDQLWEQSLELYDRFVRMHPESDFEIEVLITALPALSSMDRSEEGFKELLINIETLADNPGSKEFTELVGSYFDYVRSEAESLTAAHEQMQALQARSDISEPLRGWATIKLIELIAGERTLQDSLSQQELYQALAADFDPTQQSNYIIVMLARWYGQKISQPDQAMVLYDFIMKNRPEDSGNYAYAEADLAQLQAQSNDPEQQSIARQTFQRMLDLSGDEEIKGLATLGMGRILTGAKEYAEAQIYWENYIQNRNWSQDRAEVNFKYAYCLEAQGQKQEALKVYVTIYTNYAGHLDWSTLAYLRTAGLLNGAGKKKQALLVLRDMLQRMGHLEHANIQKGKDYFVKIRDEYAQMDTNSDT